MGPGNYSILTVSAHFGLVFLLPGCAKAITYQHMRTQAHSYQKVIGGSFYTL